MLLISYEEIILFFIGTLILFCKLFYGIDRDDVSILLAVEIGPAEAIRVNYRLRSRPGGIIALPSIWIRKNGVCEGYRLKGGMGRVLEVIRSLVCVIVPLAYGCYARAYLAQIKRVMDNFGC